MTLARNVLALAIGIALVVPAALSLADAPRAGYVPDPAGVASTKQWTFDVQVRQGVPTLGAVKSATLDKPLTTARVLGRFAIEFWIGKELLDRVRFDVPLLEDPTKRKNRRAGSPEFAVNTRLSVRMADSSRATSVVFIDRATGETKAYAWPPGSDGRLVLLPSSAIVSDAGTDAPASDAALTTDGG